MTKDTNLEKKLEQNSISIFQKINDEINLIEGSISGLLAGTVVISINYCAIDYNEVYDLIQYGKIAINECGTNTLKESLQAGGVQFLYNTFLSGAIVAQMRKSLRYGLKEWIAGIGATAIAFSIAYLTHKYTQTPEPLASSTWQIPFNLAIFIPMAYAQNNKLEVPNIIKKIIGTN